jgi:hypothetical protein
MKYGRDEVEWDELEDAGLRFLEERARLGRLTSYTEMNTNLAGRTGLHGFNFAEQADRAAMGYLLGRIAEHAYPSFGFLISALVTYLDGNDAGPGFFALAQRMRLLPPKASAAEKEAFWIAQVNKAFGRFTSTP